MVMKIPRVIKLASFLTLFSLLSACGGGGGGSGANAAAGSALGQPVPQGAGTGNGSAQDPGSSTGNFCPPPA